MSRTLNAPRWGLSAGVVGAVALLLSALAAVCLAPRAEAAFTTGKCAGSDIVGRGASFARDAHNVFINNFQPVFCAGTPALAGVTYEALGSGAGRLSMKVREAGGPRFGMSDEAPTEAEVAQMNAGTGNEPAETDTIEGDNGQIHVIPAAVGAVAPLVNFPDNCDVTLLPAGAQTPEQNLDLDATPDDVIRVRFTKAQFENIWAKNAAADTWTEVFPTLAPDADCAKPIIRVVRFDDSGTSFAFKDYLNTIDGGEGWLTTFAAVGGRTREWPNAVFGPRADCAGSPNGPGSQEDAIDQLTSGCANGNGSLVAKLVVTDGSVGYSDISTARSNSPSLAVTPEANDNDTYWTQIENAADAFTEPTSSPNGFRSDGPKGANCQVTKFANLPGSTLGDWSKATGVTSDVGFGICTLTYGLVFDDSADVWGGSPVEEAKARTVKDYWESIVSTPAQAALFPNDYAPLPANILAIAKAGVESVEWQGGTGEEGPKVTPPAPPKVTPPVPTPPSNAFSLLKKTISSKTGQAAISVKVPGAGKLVMVGTAKAGKKTIKVGQVVLNANQAGTFKLTLKPGGAAKKVLQQEGSLKVALKLTFTPAGGTAKATNSAVTLKLK
ncbi:MAG: substrate-binding domain-containing protein [Solirubrobacterales bacterium]